MDDYLVIIKDDPLISDEEFLHYLQSYGFGKRKSKLTLLLLRTFGAAPGGRGNHDRARECQDYLKACDIESEIIYTNKPVTTEFGAWMRSRRR